MSTRSDGGASAQQAGFEPVAPYTLISLLDDVALTEDGVDDDEVKITCVAFWNDNLYVGTSAGEVLHHVALPPSSDDEADSPTFILASRLKPETAKQADAASGVQQILILEDAGKACILSNSTLTFYSLPELSPAFGDTKVPKCAWVSAVQHEQPGATRVENGSLILICVDARLMIIRIGEKARRVRTIQVAGCMRAACSGNIACVSDPRSYSLLDIVEQQQIPLFEINPQASSSSDDSLRKPLPAVPAGLASNDGGAQDSQEGSVSDTGNLSSDRTQQPTQSTDPASHDPDSRDEGSGYPPRTSSLETEPPTNSTQTMEFGRPDAETASQQPIPDGPRRGAGQEAMLPPNICVLNASEFLLTTGTSYTDPGVGIFVNHDGDVVRGTLQFASYPQNVLIDVERGSGKARSPDLSPPVEVEDEKGFVLAVVSTGGQSDSTKSIEIQRLGKASEDVESSCLLSPSAQTPEVVSAQSARDLGICKSSSAHDITLPQVAKCLRLSLFDVDARQESVIDRQPNSEEFTEGNGSDMVYMRQLSMTTAHILLWTTQSIFWMAQTSDLSQLDERLNRAMPYSSKDSQTFLDCDAVKHLLDRIQDQEHTDENVDEVKFLGNRYLRQKAALLLFQDLVTQTVTGTMTYERDREMTEHVLAEADLDPRILIASIAELRRDVVIGKKGIWLHAGVQAVWQSFRRRELTEAKLDPGNRSWEGLLHILKRYLLRWRRKKGYGSVADDGALFETVDFVLLRILLILDSKHPRGRAVKGSSRAELNSVIYEGVACFDKAVQLLEQRQRLYILSRLYQGRRDFAKVLETWKRIVEGAPDAGGELTNGEEEIRAYLTKRKDKALVQEYGIWLAVRNPKAGVRVFADPESTVRFQPREVVEMLKERAPNAVKEFLEQLVFGNNLSQYANDLIGYYLDAVLEELQTSKEARDLLSTSYETYRALTPPKPAYSQFAADNTVDAGWWHSRLRLLQLLGGNHAAASQYDTQGILTRIDPFENLLVPETIILSGRQGRHEDAIRLLVHGLGDYDTAVSYCVLGGASTYSPLDKVADHPQMPSHDKQAQLFRHLLQEFLEIQDLNSRVMQTGELLGRFSRWFTMDDVLSSIPEHWSVDRITGFFENALRVLQSERYESLVLRALTSSQNLSSSAEMVEKLSLHKPIIQLEAEGT